MRGTLVAILAGVILLALPVGAQEGGSGQSAEMEAWMAAAQPGAVHKFFAEMAGTWKMQTKMWMEPGADPIDSEATVEAEMILGGRYLQEKVEGMSMGMPFEGLNIVGYDNTTGMVTSIWLDTMGTMTAIARGEYSTPGEPLEAKGTMTDPASGGEILFRWVTTFVSKDEHRFDYYMTMPGKEEMKGMAAVYTRVK